MSRADSTRGSVRLGIPVDIWTQIVFAAQESEDWKLRTLVEQAVAAAQVDVLSIPSPQEPTFDFRVDE